MNKSLFLTLPLLAAFVASPVLAKEKHGNRGHDHGRGNGDVVVRDDNRTVVVVDRERGNNPRDEGRHDNGRHLGWYKQAWRRGERLDMTYVQTTYYIDDYRQYDVLYAPPAGYRWVRPMDDRYLLVEVATGLIIEALGY
jgi:Ni/Co efflux regulator RcnB